MHAFEGLGWPRPAGLAGLAVAAALAGCGGGSGEGLDANGRPLGEGGAAVALAPTLASIQANVFTPICTGCHAGASAPMGLRLDAANAYSLLVGVASAEDGSLRRVQPGDPDASYLVRKLQGTASVGARMPYGGPYLDDATIAVIRTWIANGAPQE